MSIVVSPSAPSSMAWCTSVRICSSCGGGRLHVAFAEHVGAHRRCADEGGHVGADAAALESFQVLPQVVQVTGYLMSS